MIGFASCKAGSWNTFSTAKCSCSNVFAQMFLLLSNNKCQLAVQGVLHLSTMYSQDIFLKMHSSKCLKIYFSNIFLKYVHCSLAKCILTICFSKCISQNVFPEMYFPKCIPQNVFSEMRWTRCNYFSKTSNTSVKCIYSSNAFTSLYQLQLSHPVLNAMYLSNATKPYCIECNVFIKCNVLIKCNEAILYWILIERREKNEETFPR